MLVLSARETIRQLLETGYTVSEIFEAVFIEAINWVQEGKP